MNKAEHFRRLNEYFAKSEFAYDFFLWGAKHFGFHPKNKKISEKEAQNLMHDKIGEKLMLTKSNKVLDAGCGQGVVSAYLAGKFGCKIKGITKVSFEVEKANALARKLNIADKVNYYLMDYSNMTFNDSSFDRIYTIETLCHSTNLRKTLREFFRVLRKDGKIALFEYDIAENKNFTDYEIDIMNKVIDSTASPSLTEFRGGRFLAMLKGAGFRNIKVEDITENFKPSLNRLRKYALIPYFFVKLFHLQRNHPNLTIAVEFYKMVQKGLIKYLIYTVKK